MTTVSRLTFIEKFEKKIDDKMTLLLIACDFSRKFVQVIALIPPLPPICPLSYIDKNVKTLFPFIRFLPFNM